ncbi:hypothetical protein FHY68_22725 [Bacillus pacificus]|nr:hypothetical protein FHY68_22725 [Bacillus pacificus]
MKEEHNNRIILYKEKTLFGVSLFDLNHINFNNMYWTPIQILFYYLLHIFTFSWYFTMLSFVA